jgi:hypothetical protein
MAGGRCKPDNNKSCAAAEPALCILQDNAEAKGKGTEDGKATQVQQLCVCKCC